MCYRDSLGIHQQHAHASRPTAQTSTYRTLAGRRYLLASNGPSDEKSKKKMKRGKIETRTDSLCWLRRDIDQLCKLNLNRYLT